jgi:hypothetical protein
MSPESIIDLAFRTHKAHVAKEREDATHANATKAEAVHEHLVRRAPVFTAQLSRVLTRTLPCLNWEFNGDPHFSESHDGRLKVTGSDSALKTELEGVTIVGQPQASHSDADTDVPISFSVRAKNQSISPRAVRIADWPTFATAIATQYPELDPTRPRTPQ